MKSQEEEKEERKKKKEKEESRTVNDLGTLDATIRPELDLNKLSLKGQLRNLLGGGGRL